MHRFFISPELIKEFELTLGESESHHAVSVLRICEGERVVVLDGAGTEYMCDVAAAHKSKVQLKIKQQNKSTPLPYQITLIQAMTKGKSMDFIIQKKYIMFSNNKNIPN